MATRIEKVIEHVALEFLNKVSAAGALTRKAENIEEDFLARWPTKHSQFPMNDAMKVAAIAAIAGGERLSAVAERVKGQPETARADSWEEATDDTVEKFFEIARNAFRIDSPLEGAEALTDAVRIVLVHIAAAKGWPHSTDDDLYRVGTALATGGGFPGDGDDLYDLQKGASQEGIDLCSSLAASMGRPDAVRFGLYSDTPHGPGDDATLFARRTMDLAKRLSRLSKDRAVST